MKKLLFILLPLLFVLTAILIVTQMSASPLFYVDTMPGLSECTEVDSLLLYRLKSNLNNVNLKGVMGGSEVEFLVSTNSNGLRSPEASRDGGRYRILVLGDSCTFGLGVGNDETYPARLERLLNDRVPGERRFEVFNAGVPGYAAWQGARYLAARGMKLEPNLVIACFGNNDIVPDEDPTSTNPLPDLLHGGFIQEKLMALGLYRLVIAAQIQFLNSPERRKVKGDLRTGVPPAEQAFEAYLLEIAKVCREHKTALMFMVWPLLPQVLDRQGRPEAVSAMQPFRSRIRNQSIVREVAQSQGVWLVNPLPALAAAEQGPLYLGPIHANKKGLEVIAGVLRDAILENVLQPK